MPLNNFDTIRSYGSAGDELENLPTYSREFVQNISKPITSNHNPQSSNSLGMTKLSPGMQGYPGSPDLDSLHKSWKGALANNLKEAYYDSGKIQNGL